MTADERLLEETTKLAEREAKRMAKAGGSSRFDSQRVHFICLFLTLFFPSPLFFNVFLLYGGSVMRFLFWLDAKIFCENIYI